MRREVQKVDLKYDLTTGGFRGFAFVTLSSIHEAQVLRPMSLKALFRR